MTRTLVPVPCPRCNESQNTAPGGFDPDADPFGPVCCMACGRQFTREEFLAGLEERLRELGVSQ